MRGLEESLRQKKSLEQGVDAVAIAPSFTQHELELSQLPPTKVGRLSSVLHTLEQSALSPAAGAGSAEYYSAIQAFAQQAANSKVFLRLTSMCIMATGLIAGMVTYDSLRHNSTLNFVDHATLLVFTIEVVLKVLAHGICPYFDSNWNRLDFILTVLGISGEITGIGGILSAAVLRLLRVLRIMQVFMTQL
jgi:hypothetical protein